MQYRARASRVRIGLSWGSGNLEFWSFGVLETLASTLGTRLGTRLFNVCLEQVIDKKGPQNMCTHPYRGVDLTEDRTQHMTDGTMDEDDDIEDFLYHVSI